MPMMAVTTSMKKVDSTDTVASRAPLTAGATIMVMFWRLPLKPVTRMSMLLGVICGMSALTVGVWIPVPTERTADTKKIIHNSR